MPECALTPYTTADQARGRLTPRKKGLWVYGPYSFESMGATRPKPTLPLLFLRLQRCDSFNHKTFYKILGLGQIAFSGGKINARCLHPIASRDRGNNLLAFLWF